MVLRNPKSYSNFESWLLLVIAARGRLGMRDPEEIQVGDGMDIVTSDSSLENLKRGLCVRE